MAGGGVMIWAVVGSRSIPSQERGRFRQALAEHVRPGDSIVTGGAAGPDSWAEVWAVEHGIPVDVIRPDWAQHGKAAGFIRNAEIVRRADVVIAFWDGESHGTADTLRKTQRAAKRFLLFRILNGH